MSSGQPKQQGQTQRAVAVDPQVLAQWLKIRDYSPQIGDFIIRAGWFTVSYGVVAGISADGQKIDVIWAGLPILLFTLNDAEQKQATKKIDLSKIVGSGGGAYSVMRHDHQHNATIWFI